VCLLLRQVEKVPERVDALLVFLAALRVRVVDLAVPDVEILAAVLSLFKVRYPPLPRLALLT
jgi:hypothetical protein